jgi:replicative DNA helicase
MNNEAEKWVIGGLLLNPENIDRVRRFVLAGDFINPDHSKIFTVIEEISDREDIPLDLSIIYSALKEEDRVVEIAKYLEQDIPSDVALEYWCKVVKKQSLERRLKELTNREDIDLGEVEAIIHDLGTIGKDAPLYRPISKIPTLSEEPKSQIKTGFADLDRNLKFGPGNLMVIAGRTGEGKSSLGLEILHCVSKEKSVGVISVEMTGQEVRERVYNSFSDLPENFLVADPPALSTSDLKHICKAMRDEHGVELILIDYLQLIREREDFRTRHLEVSHIIRRIKELAKELQIAIITISQLSRSIEYRGNGSLPSLSDLKESGDIEYACDSILFIHQPQRGDEDYRGETVKLLILAKNRWGKKGKIKVYWDEDKTKFGNFQEGNGL